MFLSLDLLSEYWIQHGAIVPLYVTSSYSTWIFCRGVSGFATDCPCDVWCRGLTTCLLHVGPPFGNRFSNTSWAVGLTYWIVYLHFFFVFWHMQLYMSWYIISFFGFIFTSWIFFIFSSTPVLTSSIDLVFVLSSLIDEISQQGWHSWYHSDQWLGDTRSQYISSHGFDSVCPDYSSFGTKTLIISLNKQKYKNMSNL